MTQDGSRCLRLFGDWTLTAALTNPALWRKLHRQTAKADCWDLEAIRYLDSPTALGLWQIWGERWPDRLKIKPEHRKLFTQWENQVVPADAVPAFSVKQWFANCAMSLSHHLSQLLVLVSLLGQFLLDMVYCLRHARAIPWQEINTTIYEAGVRALGITALVGFLIGIVLSYLSALQLKIFGAEIYIIDILGISILRELGPLLAAILVAGRSGSAMTAQIGIMRVTEELDALSAMGISHSLRLVLPKLAALTLVMPLLSTWTNAAALAGGMVSAQQTLDIGYQQFFERLPDAVPLANVLIGLGKSAVFGFLTALVACYFGFKIKPNTESLGNETTKSVVAAITAVIMSDAVFAILFMDIGMP
jgi:phospholipid/cholesterol/gamma-HCH transport system permease protein